MARPTEVKAITALLEAEHPDVEALAKAVIEELDQLRMSRPSYVIRLQWDDDTRFGIGPFENRQQARTHLLGTKDRPGIHPGLSKEQADRVIVELKPLGWWTGEVATPAKGSCSECGHPTHCHNWPKYAKKRVGCIVSLTPRGEPGSNLCPCKGDGS
jgi:hypothetical protein